MTRDEMHPGAPLVPAVSLPGRPAASCVASRALDRDAARRADPPPAGRDAHRAPGSGIRLHRSSAHRLPAVLAARGRVHGARRMGSAAHEVDRRDDLFVETGAFTTRQETRQSTTTTSFVALARRTHARAFVRPHWRGRPTRISHLPFHYPSGYAWPGQTRMPPRAPLEAPRHRRPPAVRRCQGRQPGSAQGRPRASRRSTESGVSLFSW